MDKNTKLIAKLVAIIIIVAIILFLIFRYVPFGERAKFIGTWVSEDGYWVYTFYPDGTCLLDGRQGTWKIEDGKLIIELDNGRITSINEYSFSDDGKKLILSNGLVLIKQ